MRTFWVCLIVVSSYYPFCLLADSSVRIKLGTEISEMLESTSGQQENGAITQGLMNFRYLWSKSSNQWTFDLQLVSELNYAGGADRSQWLNVLPQQRVQKRAFWSLSENYHYSLSASIDRAQLTFKSDSLRASLGRFPNSWGRGIVFHPLDVFNAIAPTQMDREFKRGNDSLLIEYVFATESEVQLLSTVREDLMNNERRRNTYAVKYFVPIGNTELETVGAIHYGDEIFAVSMAVPVGDVVIRSDVVHTCLRQSTCYFSSVLNLDYTLNVLGAPLYIFGEYFFNGLGVRDLSLGHSSLSKAHTRRLNRGDLFSLGKSLLAVGAFATWHPLWNQNVTVLTNTNDRSVLLQTFVSFVPTDHASLNFGIRLPFGDINEEFGKLSFNDDLLVGNVMGVFAEFIYHR